MDRFQIVTIDLKGRRYDRQYAVVDVLLRNRGIEHSILQTDSMVRALLCRDENNLAR